MGRLFGFVIVFALFFSLGTMAQEEGEIEFIEGKIVDNNTGEIIPNVHVINAKNGYGVTTDTLGVFRIPARGSDTLRVSSIGYATELVPVNLFHGEDSLISFGLEPIVYMLQEANVRAWQWQSFKHEVLSKQIPEEQWTEKRWIANYFTEEQLTGLKHLANKNGIGFKYKSKDDRQREKVKELEKIDESWAEAQLRVNKELVARITKLQGKALDNFFETIRYTPEQISAMNDYQLTLHISELYDEFVSTQCDSIQ